MPVARGAALCVLIGCVAAVFAQYTLSDVSTTLNLLTTTTQSTSSDFATTPSSSTVTTTTTQSTSSDVPTTNSSPTVPTTTPEDPTTPLPCHLNPPTVQENSTTTHSINITWKIQNTKECDNLQLEVLCISNDTPTWVQHNGTATANITQGNIYIWTVVENLSEFTNYWCNATVCNDDVCSDPSINYEFRTQEGVPSKPQNLSVNVVGSTSFEINWSEPDKIPGVLLRYTLNIKLNSPNHFVPPGCDSKELDFWGNTSHLFYEFDQAYPDYSYEIVVFGVTSAGNGANTSVDVTTDTSEPGLPQNLKAEIFEEVVSDTDILQNLYLTWQFPCDPNGAVNKFFVVIEFFYMQDPSINDITNKSINVPPSEPDFNLTIPNLNAASSYKIKVRAERNGINGKYGVTEFDTKDNYPSEPIIEQIEQTSSNISVIWSEPTKLSGIIQNYGITVTPEGPAFKENPNCTYEEETVNVVVDGHTTSYFFDQLRPYSKYKFSIFASTSRGNGSWSDEDIITNFAEPGAPENLHYKLSVCGTDFDCYQTLDLSWFIPCNTNGILENFEIVLSGQYSEDSNYTDQRSFIVDANNDTLYSLANLVLNASYHYEISVVAVLNDSKTGPDARVNFSTDVGFPGMADFVNITCINDSKTIVIIWDEPTEKKGNILDYHLTITSMGPKIIYNDACQYDFQTYDFTENSTVMSFYNSWPFFEYNISLTARTERGFGPINTDAVETAPTVPDEASISHKILNGNSEEYDATVNVTFALPCFTNGEIKKVNLKYVGRRNGYPTVEDARDFAIAAEMTHTFKLLPDYSYSLDLTLGNSAGNTQTYQYFDSPAGVPLLSENITFESPKIKGTTEAQLLLKKEYFDSHNGEIKYIALIVSSKNVTGGEYNAWDSDNWPIPDKSTAKIYYQITETYWNPFNGSTSEVLVTIGDDKNCTDEDLFCNRPLCEDTQYFLIVRVFTQDYYKNLVVISFKTDYTRNNLGLILGLTFGLVGLALLGFFLFYAWKKKLYILTSKVLQRDSIVRESIQESSLETSVPTTQFLSYCKTLEENPDKLKEQYRLLNEQSNDMCSGFATMYALLPENKRKNRYTNILPYDETRVKLRMDEDDEISSDYINASYIKGYSGKTEYIATQGPMPSTCKDFWKMILQEQIKVVVMVSQFVEDSKEKCFKYFPNNHENMLIDDNIEVRCATELHFGTYCVRTLQVKKDLKKETVTHMQFLDWPDFGVPVGTENMLQFCYRLREKIHTEGGVVVVHCSAGVGRTGTLIATDILLQVIKSGRNIDVHKTILDLRMQRKNMVQTDKQYMYIHKLLCDNIDNPVSNEPEIYGEPVYENLSVFKKPDNIFIVKDIESKL